MKNGKYMVQFVPLREGKLNIDITLYGQHITHSPFPVTVKEVESDTEDVVEDDDVIFLKESTKQGMLAKGNETKRKKKKVSMKILANLNKLVTQNASENAEQDRECARSMKENVPVMQTQAEFSTKSLAQLAGKTCSEFKCYKVQDQLNDKSKNIKIEPPWSDKKSCDIRIKEEQIDDDYDKMHSLKKELGPKKSEIEAGGDRQVETSSENLRHQQGDSDREIAREAEESHHVDTDSVSDISEKLNTTSITEPSRDQARRLFSTPSSDRTLPPMNINLTKVTEEVEEVQSELQRLEDTIAEDTNDVTMEQEQQTHPERSKSTSPTAAQPGDPAQLCVYNFAEPENARPRSTCPSPVFKFGSGDMTKSTMFGGLNEDDNMMMGTTKTPQQALKRRKVLHNDKGKMVGESPHHPVKPQSPTSRKKIAEKDSGKAVRVNIAGKFQRTLTNKDKELDSDQGISEKTVSKILTQARELISTAEGVPKQTPQSDTNLLDRPRSASVTSQGAETDLRFGRSRGMGFIHSDNPAAIKPKGKVINTVENVSSNEHASVKVTVMGGNTQTKTKSNRALIVDDKPHRRIITFAKSTDNTINKLNEQGKVNETNEQQGSHSNTNSKVSAGSSDNGNMRANMNKSNDVPSKSTKRGVTPMGEYSAIMNHVSCHAQSNHNKPIPAIFAKHVNTIGQKGKDAQSLSFPIGVTVAPSGDVIICDHGNDMVKVFTPDGTNKFTLGDSGSAVFKRPSATVTNDAGDIFVKDMKTIQVFNKNGEKMRLFGKDILQSPYGIALNSFRDLVTVDPQRIDPSLFIFNQDGQLIQQSLFSPILEHKRGSKCRFLDVFDQHLIVSDLGHSHIYMTNFNGALICDFGGFGTDHGLFREPSGVSIDLHGNMMIADSKNDRVQIFNEDGEFLCPVKLSERIWRPSDIQITPDGLLYMSSLLGHCVKVYELQN
ncbi:unnamed protein product [Owenia fusiformis]|uniref:Uncharacterized protein n=1 Tax=Owenia fusiformis TaxID=6347 RepID=A0A8J1XLN9_OWEFU|nr:unnamed protein product [Owenia fusiformis]